MFENQLSLKDLQRFATKLVFNQNSQSFSAQLQQFEIRLHKFLDDPFITYLDDVHPKIEELSLQFFQKLSLQSALSVLKFYSSVALGLITRPAILNYKMSKALFKQWLKCIAEVKDKMYLIPHQLMSEICLTVQEILNLRKKQKDPNSYIRTRCLKFINLLKKAHPQSLAHSMFALLKKYLETTGQLLDFPSAFGNQKFSLRQWAYIIELCEPDIEDIIFQIMQDNLSRPSLKSLLNFIAIVHCSNLCLKVFIRKAAEGDLLPFIKSLVQNSILFSSVTIKATIDTKPISLFQFSVNLVARAVIKHSYFEQNLILLYSPLITILGRIYELIFQISEFSHLEGKFTEWVSLLFQKLQKKPFFKFNYSLKQAFSSDQEQQLFRPYIWVLQENKLEKEVNYLLSANFIEIILRAKQLPTFKEAKQLITGYIQAQNPEVQSLYISFFTLLCSRTSPLSSLLFFIDLTTAKGATLLHITRVAHSLSELNSSIIAQAIRVMLVLGHGIFQNLDECLNLLKIQEILYVQEEENRDTSWDYLVQKSGIILAYHAKKISNKSYLLTIEFLKSIMTCKFRDSKKLNNSLNLRQICRISLQASTTDINTSITICNILVEQFGSAYLDILTSQIYSQACSGLASQITGKSLNCLISTYELKIQIRQKIIEQWRLYEQEPVVVKIHSDLKSDLMIAILKKLIESSIFEIPLLIYKKVISEQLKIHMFKPDQSLIANSVKLLKISGYIPELIIEAYETQKAQIKFVRLLHNYLQERHIEFGNKKTGEIKNFSLYKFALLKLQ